MLLYKHVTANNIKLEKRDFIRELSMEAYLIENESVLSLNEDDLVSPDIIESELTVKLGRKSRETDGRIDLIAVYSSEYLGVIELKLGELRYQHLKQLEDYLAERKQIVQILREKKQWTTENEPKFIGVLVGTEIDIELVNKISNSLFIENNIPVYAVVLKRFKSNDGNIYVISDVYGPKYSNKDYSTYSFNGCIYNKRKLVLEVVKRIVAEDANLTLARLKEDFPIKLQGTYGVFDTLENVKLSADEKRINRFFMKEDEILDLKDARIVVCNQWGLTNTERFVDRVKKLYKYEIIKNNS